MNENTFLILFDDVRKCIKERRLADALNAMLGLASFSANFEIRSEIEDISRSYDMLLDYMEKGYEDAERSHLLLGFFRVIFECSLALRRDFELKEEHTHYAMTWQTLQRMERANAMSSLFQAKLSYRQMFDIVWTSGVWSGEDKESIRLQLLSDTVTECDKCILLGATMLSALHYFDVRKMELLLDFLTCPDVRCRIRAEVGFVLIYLKYAEELSFYPDLQARMRLLRDDSRLMRELQTIQLQLFLSQNTKEVERQLEEEIIPEMMKKAKHFGLGKKMGIETDWESMKSFDINPEWEEQGANSPLADKMRRLVEMQQKGADIFIGQFKLLKQRFPFFSVAANWFVPFDPRHPEIAAVPSGLKSLDKLFASGRMCDSDKYSFCLMLSSLPSQQRDMLEQQLSSTMGEIDAGNEVLPGGEYDGKEDSAMAIRIYLQDIYRFFKLFRGRDEKLDPFRQNLLLSDYPVFKDYFSEPVVIRQFADFLFDDKSYLQASRLYERLEPDAEFYQRIGYCRQQLHEFGKAVEAYERACLFSSESAWTLRQLAFCYRMTGDIDSTLRCYEQLEKINPDDTDILQRLGECYIQKENYAAAFEKLYKVNYLTEDSKNSNRALAWCSLVTGKYEQARRYYDKLMGMNPNAADCLNAGHAAWLSGDVRQCVECYRKAVALEGLQTVSAEFFAEDMDFLNRQGKSVEDIRLMVDLINRGNK